ncbi:MAG: V4R domain-containing protein [Halobacteriota archaeon]|nr:V4R domain-containing protein [Halobacteriota archaeon]
MPKSKISGMKMEDGKLFHYGIRVGMLDFKIFNIIFKEADRLIGPVVGTIIYRAVKKQTAESVNSILEATGFKIGEVQEFDDKTMKSLLKMGVADLMSQFGWGSMKITEFDTEAGFIRLCVKDSVVADSYDEEQEKPVCFFISGMIAGGASALLDRDIECKEVKCKACGEDHCEFVISVDYQEDSIDAK